MSDNNDAKQAEASAWVEMARAQIAKLRAEFALPQDDTEKFMHDLYDLSAGDELRRELSANGETRRRRSERLHGIADDLERGDAVVVNALLTLINKTMRQHAQLGALGERLARLEAAVGLEVKQ